MFLQFDVNCVILSIISTKFIYKLRTLLLTLLLAAVMSLQPISAQCPADKDFMLDGPGMVALNPSYYAHKLYGAWTRQDPFTRAELDKLIKDFECEVLDTDTYVVGDGSDEYVDEMVDMLVLHCGQNCLAHHSKVAIEGADSIEVIELLPEDIMRRAIGLVLSAAHPMAGPADAYNFMLGDGMLRLGFSERHVRDQVLQCLLEMDKFTYDDTDKCYVRVDETGEEDWGTVIVPGDDDEELIHWVQITSFL